MQSPAVENTMIASPVRCVYTLGELAAAYDRYHATDEGKAFAFLNKISPRYGDMPTVEAPAVSGSVGTAARDSKAPV